MHPNVLRGLVAIAVLGILVVGAIPLLILMDLSSDGTGWGLCEQGLDSCRVGGFSGARLAGLLLAGLFGLAALLRFIVWIAGKTGRRDVPTTNSEFFIP